MAGMVVGCDRGSGACQGSGRRQGISSPTQDRALAPFLWASGGVWMLAILDLAQPREAGGPNWRLSRSLSCWEPGQAQACAPALLAAPTYQLRRLPAGRSLGA